MADNYNERAAKGQALNLAVNEAISKGKTDDSKFILNRFVHYYNLSNAVQEATIDEIKQMLKGA